MQANPSQNAYRENGREFVAALLGRQVGNKVDPGFRHDPAGPRS